MKHFLHVSLESRFAKYLTDMSPNHGRVLVITKDGKIKPSKACLDEKSRLHVAGMSTNSLVNNSGALVDGFGSIPSYNYVDYQQVANGIYINQNGLNTDTATIRNLTPSQYVMTDANSNLTTVASPTLSNPVVQGTVTATGLMAVPLFH